MKQSIVKYRRVGLDKIEIVAFKNIASVVDLSKDCGPVVAKEYFQGAPTYERGCGKRILIKTSPESGYDVEVGSVVTREEFQTLVATMKQAGNRLTMIRNQVDNEVVREVLI